FGAVCGKSTSAPGATEITPAANPPGQTSEPRVIQPSPEASLGEGFGAVVVSSDESNPATPLFPEAGPSTGDVRPSSDGEFDPRVWLDFSDPKWDRARNQLQGLVDRCLDPSLQRRRPGLGSYREQTGHYHADVSQRVRTKPASRQYGSLVFTAVAHLFVGRMPPAHSSHVFSGRRRATLVPECKRFRGLLASFGFAQQFALRTFPRVVDRRRESQSASDFEVCWQVLALHSSSLFARFLGSSTGDSSTGDVSPKVRAISRSAGKFWLCTAVHSSHVVSINTRRMVCPVWVDNLCSCVTRWVCPRGQTLSS
ncbi:hypothetical protein PanWU01x14_296920, partial [Parasponia andersonii]